jgi:hypothetical protein
MIVLFRALPFENLGPPGLSHVFGEKGNKYEFEKPNINF